MKLVSLFIVLISALAFAGEAKESRSIHQYSLKELLKTGDEWVKFCEYEKELLSMHKEKFATFVDPSTLSVADSAFDNALPISVGGMKLKFPMPLTGNRLVTLSLNKNDFHITVKSSNGTKNFSISRYKTSEIKDWWSYELSETTRPGDEDTVGNILLSKMYPDGGVTDVDFLMDIYSSTPSDLQCTNTSENFDKRLLLALGVKGIGIVEDGRLDIVKLKHLHGYASFE